VLVISRKENEVITIEPVGGLDPNLTLRHAFSQGPIAIKLVRISGRKVRIAIAAPKHLKIWRGAEVAPENCDSEADLVVTVEMGEPAADLGADS
jgi:sRNA-binding carbon storage regulator CsrA